MIIEHGDTRPFEPFDRFGMLERDRGVPLDKLIDHFAELRQQSLGGWTSWSRTRPTWIGAGCTPSLGEVTMRELIATWAVHDLDHVSQIYSALAGSRDADVGPWKAVPGNPPAPR